MNYPNNSIANLIIQLHVLTAGTVLASNSKTSIIWLQGYEELAFKNMH